MRETFDPAGDSNAKLIILTTVFLFGVFIFWSYNTRLDMVTRAQGRVIVTGQNHSVQVPQRGTITKYHVRIGDTVDVDQLLAEVNPTEAAAQLGEIEQRLETMNLRLARLDAELDGRSFTQDESPDSKTNDLIRAESELMAARKEDLRARQEALMQSRQQKERELEALQAELDGVIQSEIVLKSEAKQILPLVELGVLGISEKFRFERDQNQIETQEKILNEKIQSLRFSILETEAQINATQTGYFNEILNERARILGEMTELSERLPSLRQRVKQTEIRSPVSGTINQVFFNIEGAVVSEGAVIAEIVPDNGELLVEALVLPEDIANVEPGQLARISLTAYDAARFGTVEGKVIHVSADASFREETQNRMFVVETSLDTVLLDQNKVPVSIIPGMVAQVDIVRGQRSILDYFWNPVAKMQDRALRE